MQRARAGAVEFSDVIFGYGLGGRVLHGVSFSVSGGQTVALVGATGSGKARCQWHKFRQRSKTPGAWVRALPMVHVLSCRMHHTSYPQVGAVVALPAGRHA
jgi:ATPase subunit of ABC transporter with duplicated ATPase domains